MPLNLSPQLGQDLVCMALSVIWARSTSISTVLPSTAALGFLAVLELRSPLPLRRQYGRPRWSPTGNAANLRQSGQGVLHGSREVEIARLWAYRHWRYSSQHLMALRAQVRA